jgi:phosphoserine phosphatase
MFTTLIHRAVLDGAAIDSITRSIPGELERRDNHYRLYHRNPVEMGTLITLRDSLRCDLNALPPGFDATAVRLVASDMDSTLIAIECLDELAGVAGGRERLAPITEATMRGELDFAASLRQRVAMLRGVPLDALDVLCQQRLTPSPGAGEMLAGLKQRAIPVALVTGGFVQIAQHLQQTLGLAYSLGIEPEVVDGALSGNLPAELVDATAKAEYLRRLCREMGIAPSQVIAIGDGANDVPMLQSAGLGIAYRGKPVVQAAAAAVLNYAGLEAVLDFID